MPFRKIFTAIAVTTVFSLCTASGAAETVDKYLDRDGFEYSFISARGRQVISDRFDNMLNESIWISRLSSEEKRQILIRISFWKLLYALSGLENASAFGCSAKDLPGGETVNNRLFLAIDPAAPGLINEFFLRKNSLKTADFLRSLPESTSLAVRMNIKPSALIDALEKSGNYCDSILAALPVDLPLRELLSGTAGQWDIVFLHSGAWQLELPDPSKRLFNLASLLAEKKFPAQKKLVLPGGITIIERQKSLIFYMQSQWADEFAEAQNDKLDAGKYAYLTGRLPANGAGMFFDATFNPPKRTVNIGGYDFYGSFSSRPALGVLSAEKDGWLLAKNGDCELIVDLLQLTASFFQTSEMPQKNNGEENTGTPGTPEEEASGNDPADDDPEPRPESSDSPEEEETKVEDTPCRCAELLAAAEKLPRPGSSGLYAIADGKFVKASAENYIVALFLTNGGNKPLPLFISRPHGNKFSVLFTDGKIESFILDRPKNFRRITGFLQSVKMFDEQSFRQLVTLADQFDRQ